MPRIDGKPVWGVVAIGRNEGERLERCLDSATAQLAPVVYVDSGSTDDSVAAARRRGVEVVELDMAIPFTAARARNEGLRRLREVRPDVELVQFVDGDCELVPGWIPAAHAAILGSPDVAVVCGRRRERHRDATIYNRLCDLEWDTPVGEADACGGDSMMRIAALERTGGFDPRLIAGEEPDLCLRLRGLGYRILRIDVEMTLHDAAIRHFHQWWRRMIRSGHAAAEALARNGASTPEVDRRCVRGVFVWVVVLPALVGAGWIVAALRGSLDTAVVVTLLAAAGLCAQIARIAVRRPAPGEGAGDAWVYAVACMAAKLPQAVGMLQYLRNRLRRLTPQLIEYK